MILDKINYREINKEEYDYLENDSNNEVIKMQIQKEGKSYSDYRYFKKEIK